MTDLATLLGRIETTIEDVVRSGDVGVARSLRLHVGGQAGALPDAGRLLSFADALFGCPRVREVRSDGATLCVWEGGQVGTISLAPAPRNMVVLTVLGSGGALHMRELSS